MADADGLPDIGSRDDTQGERYESSAQRFGIPVAQFSGVMDAAINHARNAPLSAGQRRWVPIGPRNVGGRIIGLAQAHDNPSTIYAAAAQGGTWRTRDYGERWEPVGGPDMAFVGGAIAIADG